MKFVSPRTRILLITLLTIVVALLGNWLTNMYDEYLKNIFGRYYSIILPCVFLLITALLVWLTLKHSDPADNAKLSSTGVIDPNRDRIIRYLQNLYTLKHQNKLDDRLALNLEFKYSQVGTDQAYVDKFFLKEAKTDEDVQAGLLELSEQHRYLLIVGEPGAGKTTLLIDLALSLLKDKKMQDLQQPIPIIFNMAYWEERYKGNFIRWMENRMVEENICSRRIATELISSRKLIPLLDGLDEIRTGNSGKALAYRDCLDDIENYLSQYNPEKMVIASRIEEYKNVDSNAPIRAQILVKALTTEQLRSILSEALSNHTVLSVRPYANPVAVQNILGLMKEHPQLSEVLCIPFYFNLACQVLSTTNSSVNIPAGTEPFKEFLVSQFVELTLNTGGKKWPSPKKSRKWLRDLADVLQFGSRNATSRSTKDEFTSSDLFDLSRDSISWNYIAWIGDILTSTLTGVYFWFFFGNPNYIWHGTLIGFINYLFSPIIIIYFDTVLLRRIRFLSKLRGMQRSVFLNSIYYLVFALTMAGFALINKAPYLYAGLKIFLADLLAYYLYAGLFILLFKYYTNAYTISSQVQRYLRNGRIILRECLVFTFMGVIIPHLFTQYHNIFFLVLMIAVRLFMISDIYTKIMIRSVKVITGKLPLRHVKFLDFATQRRILERDGNSWRFRHKILLDYFSKLNPGN